MSKGDNNPKVAQNWLKEIKKLMEIADIPEKQIVILASSALIGEADFCWDSIKRNHNIDIMMWDDFDYFSANTPGSLFIWLKCKFISLV